MRRGVRLIIMSFESYDLHLAVKRGSGYSGWPAIHCAACSKLSNVRYGETLCLPSRPAWTVFSRIERTPAFLAVWTSVLVSPIIHEDRRSIFKSADAWVIMPDVGLR